MPEERSLFDGLSLRGADHADPICHPPWCPSPRLTNRLRLMAATRSERPRLVLLDAAESDPSVIVGHQPGDGAFDHRSPLSVVGGEVAVAPGPPGFDEFGVVSGEGEGCDRLWIWCTWCEAGTLGSAAEDGGAPCCDGHGVAGRTSGRPSAAKSTMKSSRWNPPVMAVEVGQGLMARWCLALAKAPGHSPEP